MIEGNTYADLAIMNTNVITLDSRNTRGEAVAVKHGRILSVGTDGEIRKLIGGGTKTLELRGKTVLPGFIDTHVHLADFGLTLSTLNLEMARSIDEILDLLEERIRSTPKGEWVMGRGWNENRLAERRSPNRWDLDRVSPDHPVYLHHYTCHACVLNSKGLEISKIDRHTKPPPGGWISVDKGTSEPTGFLRSNARFLAPVGFNGYRPRPSRQGLAQAISRGAEEAVKAGLTGLHVASADSDEIRICLDLASEGKLPLRITLMPRVELLDSLKRIGVRTSFGSEWVKLGPIKIFSDGSLIAHTAAMSRHFEGEPENVGILDDQKLFTRQIKDAHRAGMQVAVHATGDRAMEAVVDAYEEALKEAPRGDHRHRIEHGSFITKGLIERIRRLGIIISTQPELVAKYGDGFESSLGSERIGQTYPYRSLIEAGVVVTGSSDCPLTYCSPLKGIQAAVTRTSENTGKTVSEEQRISLDDAIRMYTVNAAYASFEETLKGTIEKGKLANFTVLSDEPWSVPADRIGDIEVEATIVGGSVAYMRGD
jgi:hypothetical protein